MKNFEYQKIRQPSEDVLIETLDSLGAEGWELVCTYGIVEYLFKREVTEDMLQERLNKALGNQWLRYRDHLMECHETVTYIDDDIVGSHDRKYPDCNFRSEI